MRPEHRRLAGQLFVTGFEGTTLSPRLARSLAEGDRAGVILFRRNLPDVATMRAITARVGASVNPSRAELPLLVCLDEEGGRVSRLPPSEPRLPSMRTLGALSDATLTSRAGAAIGAHLLALGVNFNFAPVLDVDSNPKNPVIGDRAFSPDPGHVAEHGLAFARGLAEAGVLACGKHFPGHGDTDVDSHLALPALDHGEPRLRSVELAPFAAAAQAGLEALMTAHVVLRSRDAALPATLSPSVMTGLLREELGYRGVVVSDDLEMRAISARWGVAEAAVLAISAGCDLVLVCRDEDRADEAVEAVAREVERSPAFRLRVEDAAKRNAALRALARDRASNALLLPTAGRPSLADVLEEIAAREADRGRRSTPPGADPTERSDATRGGG